MKRSDNKLVYIVDDDPDDRQIILDAFLENKYQGDYAFIETGDQLLEDLRDPDKLFPSLIMLDLNLPGIIGLLVLQEIRREKQYSHIPIIILTTSSLHMDRKLAYEYGTNCFLRKPNSFQYLVSLMDAIIRLWLIDNDL
ncbi:MAG TPA: response regulator [Puia sp.]|jgi:DNA-binding response OmpR family regulator|nr:response regulator [Puia sp.]